MSELLSLGYIESVRKELQSWTRNPSPYNFGTLSANDIELLRDAFAFARALASALLGHIDALDERNRSEVERIKADRDALRDELEALSPKAVPGSGDG
jgi:hypothetical protein